MNAQETKSVEKVSIYDSFKKIEPEHIRKCHDCGKKTTQYRCNACWLKFRKKNGVSIYNPEEEDEPCCIFR